MLGGGLHRGDGVPARLPPDWAVTLNAALGLSAAHHSGDHQLWVVQNVLVLNDSYISTDV